MTTVRSILKDYGIRPRKRLGQSFLEDKNVISKIILAADIHAQDIVVEIGAGLGIMTEILASQAGKVIAIDVDPRMTAILRERLKGQALTKRRCPRLNFQICVCRNRASNIFC